MGAGLSIPTAALADPPQYRIIDLHNPALANGSIAYGINDIGEVAGDLLGSNAGAFAWLLRDNYGLDRRIMLDLSDTAIGGPTGSAVALDINTNGMIVGEVDNRGHLWDLDPAGSHMFLFSSAESPSVARAINNNIVPTIVGRYDAPADGFLHGFRLQLGSTVEQLLPIPNAPDSPPFDFHATDGTAVSDFNWAVGRSTDAINVFCSGLCGVWTCSGATWWSDSTSQGSPLAALGGGPGSRGDDPRGVNNVHDVVGATENPSVCRTRATIWPTGDFDFPESLPLAEGQNPNNDVTVANAIADPIAAGGGTELHIVGTNDTQNVAMLWRGNPGDRTAYDLNSVTCGENLPPVDLREAHDVNNLGWIVGRMTVNPDTPQASDHAVVLIPLDWCPGDINAGSPDAVVNVLDLLALLGAWGTCPQDTCCLADLDADGNVGVADLLLLLAEWGTCPGFSHLDEPDSLEELSPIVDSRWRSGTSSLMSWKTAQAAKRQTTSVGCKRI